MVVGCYIPSQRSWVQYLGFRMFSTGLQLDIRPQISLKARVLAILNRYMTTLYVTKTYSKDFDLSRLLVN